MRYQRERPGLRGIRNQTRGQPAGYARRIRILVRQQTIETRCRPLPPIQSDRPHARSETADVGPWVERCLERCDRDQRVLNALFRGNARSVWGLRG